MSKETEWNKQFNIGIDSIDNAHRKLFSIVRRLVHLSRDENNGQWACAEGIKYFKNYAIEHFTDEEAHMQSMGYKGYEIHKRLHDDMRYKTLTALEKELTESNYSQESIQHFLGICLGWLTAHILIEDRAITGKISNRWKTDHAGADQDALENALIATIQEIFRLPTEIVSEHYSGEDFGTSLIIRLTYRSALKKRVQIFMVLENSLVLRAVSAMLDMPLTKMDKLVMNAGKELSLRIVEQLGIHCRLSSQYQLESSHIIAVEQFRKMFYMAVFDYSLLLNTGHGYFAFCVKLE
ncbi:MAG: hemerythrin domain-containing protein [Lachnospiraceae bacterium]|nr:hemerythrin domain-containing protein [Lachnospiraceae bacterium]